MRIKEHVLADSGFPPSERIMSPFDMRGRKNALSEEQIYFNRRVSAARCMVEQALGQLKKRFPLLR